MRCWLVISRIRHTMGFFGFLINVFHSPDADDADDEWETVYGVVENYTRGSLVGTLIETYGGGPSGGYFITDNKVFFSWHQEWFQERTFKRLNNVFDIEYRKIDGAPPGGPWEYLEMKLKK